MTAHISIAQLDLLKKQVQTLRSMDHSEHPLSVCDKACEVAEAIETLISAYEEQAKVVEKRGMAIDAALSWLNLIHHRCAGTINGKPVQDTTQNAMDDIRNRVAIAATPAAESERG